MRIVCLALCIWLFESGTLRAQGRTVQFAGFDWDVKRSSGKVGPGPNYFSDSTDNVWVDSLGLHLRITRRGGRWYLWLFQGRRPGSGREAEIIIKDFKIEP